MGCISSRDKNHVIYVKPRTENGINSLNENFNQAHKQQSRDETANNNTKTSANHMVSKDNKQNDITSETVSKDEKRKSVSRENTATKGKLANSVNENLQESQRLSHDVIKHESGAKESGNSKEKDSDKKSSTKNSDAKTKASSVTEWETDSELLLEKDIDDVERNKNIDQKNVQHAESGTVRRESLENKMDTAKINNVHEGDNSIHETHLEGDDEAKPIVACYVGSDETHSNDKKRDATEVMAYASYIGTDNTENSKTDRETTSNPLFSAQHEEKGETDHERHELDEKKVTYPKVPEGEQGDIHPKLPIVESDTKTHQTEEIREISENETAGPAPTVVKAQDIMPSADVLRVLADQVKKNPIALKPPLGSLVKHLTKPASTDMEKVWAFYRWIVINIKYDVEGFFGDAPAKPSDPVNVLKTGVALCDGYTNLVMELCKKSNVEAQIISGYAKPYGYNIGDDVSTLDSCKHKWNAVKIDGSWFFMDCTWGAGFIKPRDRKYIRWPNDFYFLTDPEIFVSDHFPMMEDDYDTSCKWQLLEMPVSLESFIKRVNMDQPGKEWGILTHHHPYAVIDVQNEAEIMVEESHTPMLDYMVHMRNDDYQLMDKYTFAYKSNTNTFKVHVRPPVIGEYMCQIYGRRVVDGKDAPFQPLVLYKLECTEVYDRPREFPKHNAVFGPVPDIKSFGFSHTGNVLYKAEFGEVTILLNPNREISFVPHLYIGDTEYDYLRENCLVQYSEDFRHVTIGLRLPFEGFFRLTLFGKQTKYDSDDEDDGGRTSKSTSTPIYNVKFRRPKSNSTRASAADDLKPFVSYLIDNRQASDKDPFPFAYDAVLKYKCCLLQPTDKEVKTEREIRVCLRSLFLERIKAGEDLIPKVDETTFAGNTVTTKADTKFIIYGSESKDGDDFVPLYECTTSR